MELADGREPGGAHLAVGALVQRDRTVVGRLSRPASASIASRQAQKSPPAARPAERALEGVAVRVHETGKRDRLAPRATTLTFGGMADLELGLRAAPPAPERAHDPAVRSRSRCSSCCSSATRTGRAGRPGSSSGSPAHHRPARRLARAPLAASSRSFGKVADPLADRLMIDVCRRPARRRRPAALGRARDPARATLLLIGGLQARRPARVRVRGLTAREDRDLGPVRVARARARHRARHLVAARAASGSASRSRSSRPGSTSPKAMREVRTVKAVVMAGGEGTRLRPLTSNQPKPMVPDRRQAVHGAHPRARCAATASTRSS